MTICDKSVEIPFIQIGNKWFDIFRVYDFMNDISYDPAETFIDDDEELLDVFIHQDLIEANSKLYGVTLGDNYKQFYRKVRSIYIKVNNTFKSICSNMILG